MDNIIIFVYMNLPDLKICINLASTIYFCNLLSKNILTPIIKVICNLFEFRNRNIGIDEERRLNLEERHLSIRERQQNINERELLLNERQQLFSMRQLDLDIKKTGNTCNEQIQTFHEITSIALSPKQQEIIYIMLIE